LIVSPKRFNVKIYCLANILYCLFAGLALTDTSRQTGHLRHPKPAFSMANEHLSHPLVYRSADPLSPSLIQLDHASVAPTPFGGELLDSRVTRKAVARPKGKMVKWRVVIGVGLGVGCAFATGSHPKQDPLNRGLLHWWKLDGNTLDSAGEISSPAIGPVSYIDSPVGRGIVFDGTNTAISLPPSPEMQFNASFSISAWAMLKAYPSDSQIWATIIFEGDDRPGLDPYDIQVAPDGTLQFLVTSSARASGVNAPTKFPLDRWVFVTGTYDKAEGIQSLYVDGKLVAQVTDAPDLTPVVPLVPFQNAGIGIGTNNAYPYSVYNMGWRGAISDIRVYNRALSAKEVTMLSDRE
jgi:hypothetical protein